MDATVVLSADRTEDRAPHDRPADSGRLRFLDGWRAVAIAGVLVDHFAAATLASAGRLGVELFFVLSGRLMAHILFVERIRLGRFFHRRFSRVWPGLAIFVQALLIWSHAVGPLGITRLEFAAALTYTTNYLALWGWRTGPRDHILVAVRRRTHLRAAGPPGVDGASPAASVLAAHDRDRLRLDARCDDLVAGSAPGLLSVYWRSDARAASILAGVLAYMAARRGVLRLHGVAPVAAGLIGAVIDLSAAPDEFKYTVGTVCLALCVANLDFAPESVRRALSAPVLAGIGTLTFAIYVWQQPFAFAARPTAGGQALRLALALAAAVIAFAFVERPARRWLNAHPPRCAR